jgi:hypothetical protein
MYQVPILYIGTIYCYNYESSNKLKMIYLCSIISKYLSYYFNYITIVCKTSYFWFLTYGRHGYFSRIIYLFIF